MNVMTIRAKRALVLIVMVIASFALIHAKQQPVLVVEWTGYTNHFRGMGREAIIAVSNQSDATLTLTFLPERKNPEWPVHNRLALQPHLSLSSYAATNFSVRLQPNDGVWRVRVLYRQPTTKLQAARNKWSVKIKSLNWPRLAALVQPELAKVVVTPEMDLSR